jgi:hypothetical protein
MFTDKEFTYWEGTLLLKNMHVATSTGFWNV